MRGILINTYGKKIYDVDHPDTLRDIYAQLSSDVHRIEMFQCLGVSREEVLYIDDEGLLTADRRPDDIRFFCWKGFAQPIAGNGLILGMNPWGNSVSSRVPLQYVMDRVSFPDIKMSGWMEQESVIPGITMMPVPVFEPRVARDAGHA